MGTTACDNMGSRENNATLFKTFNRSVSVDPCDEFGLDDDLDLGCREEALSIPSSFETPEEFFINAMRASTRDSRPS